MFMHEKYLKPLHIFNENISQNETNPTDAIRAAVSPRIGVGPGFDSQGSVNFFPNTAFPTYTESMSKLLG